MLNKFLNFEFEIKEAKEKDGFGVVEGYASTFGNMDLGLDIVDAGAFKKTIAESKGRWPILADHDPRQQIGWNTFAEEDAKGLKVIGELDIVNNAKARERYSLAKKGMELGAKVGLSIGYATIKEEPDATNPRIRHLKEVKLYEYSFVTFPMNTEAMVTAAKQWFAAGSLDTALSLFVEEMKKSGYLEHQLFSALDKIRAAKSETDPEKLLQSIRAGVANIKKTLVA